MLDDQRAHRPWALAGRRGAPRARRSPRNGVNPRRVREDGGDLAAVTGQELLALALDTSACDTRATQIGPTRSRWRSIVSTSRAFSMAMATCSRRSRSGPARPSRTAGPPRRPHVDDADDLAIADDWHAHQRPVAGQFADRASRTRDHRQRRRCGGPARESRGPDRQPSPVRVRLDGHARTPRRSASPATLSTCDAPVKAAFVGRQTVPYSA